MGYDFTPRNKDAGYFHFSVFTWMGFCFDCATKGEQRAAKRTVRQHLAKGVASLRAGSSAAKYDFKWAWERATRTGDYKKGGYFDGEGIDWR